MKVSVCIITYNHESFILTAIESVLQQRTNFPFNIIVGEDNSSDRTREICEELAARHPNMIHLLPPQPNLGMMNNFIQTIKACNGEYVAFLEGDDYWTDDDKLQKQVEFLDKEKDYCACFHNVTILNSKFARITSTPFHTNLVQDSFETEDLLRQWFIPSASVLFVNYRDFVFPDWFSNCKSGDIPFLLLLSLRGKIKYLNELMGVYRIHGKGISSAHVGYDKMIAMIFIYENFNIYTQHRFKMKIREAMIYEIDYHYPDNFRKRERMGKRKTSPIGRLYSLLLKKVNSSKAQLSGFIK